MKLTPHARITITIEPRPGGELCVTINNSSYVGAPYIYVDSMWEAAHYIEGYLLKHPEPFDRRPCDHETFRQRQAEGPQGSRGGGMPLRGRRMD